MRRWWRWRWTWWKALCLPGSTPPSPISRLNARRPAAGTLGGGGASEAWVHRAKAVPYSVVAVSWKEQGFKKVVIPEKQIVVSRFARLSTALSMPPDDTHTGSTRTPSSLGAALDLKGRGALPQALPWPTAVQKRIKALSSTSSAHPPRGVGPASCIHLRIFNRPWYRRLYHHHIVPTARVGSPQNVGRGEGGSSSALTGR